MGKKARICNEFFADSIKLEKRNKTGSINQNLILMKYKKLHI